MSNDSWDRWFEDVQKEISKATGIPDMLIDQHTSGAKLDEGKNRLALVLGEFSHALWDVGEVGTFGANKYTPRGWLEVPNAKERYMDALMRHLFHHFSGEERDPESNLKHLAHAAWNILAVLDLEYRTWEKKVGSES